MENLPPIEIDPKTFLRQHCALPALPEMVMKIQTMIQNDSGSINEVSSLISTDPSLVAQLLKVVNSAYYSLPQEIAKVQFAIAFLGLNEVYRMVLALSAVNTLAVKHKNDLTAFWFHSFYTALCTKHLAKQYSPQLSFDELWSSAILHDIGKLVYLKFFPDHYRELVKFSKEQGVLFSRAEEHFSVPSSSFLGILLCDHWLLPAKVRDACRWHSLKDLQALQRDNSPAGDFRRMVCLGNMVAVLAHDELNTEIKHELARAITTTLKSSEADFLALMGTIYDLRIEAEDFMKKFS